MKRNAFLAIVSILLAVSSGCGGTSPAATSTSREPADDLEAEVKALRELAPDQAHVMADVGYHFTNLWFAGTSENWPLADFYLGETRSHLRWAIRTKPIRKDNAGRDVNLGNILEAFEGSQLTQLKKALDAKNRAVFEEMYKECLVVCYACHKASDKPYLRPRVPARSEVDVINFDPKADWPL